jgi:DNA-binding NarL/FixJ family response regulator
MATTAYSAPKIDQDRKNDAATPVRLTVRQREVLALLCEGLPNKLICKRLNISSGTVKAHIAAILRELGVATRVQAVINAHRVELFDEPMGIAEHTDHTDREASREMRA